MLLAGDTLAYLTFAAIGRMSHSEAAGLGALGEVFGTAAPFLLGWLAVAPLTGAYRLPAPPTAQPEPARTDQPGSRLRFVRSTFAGRSLLTWLLAMPLGFALRALFLQRGIPVSFAVVASLSVLVIVVGWRVVFAWLVLRRAR
jgi:hypothetical protein